MSSRSPALTGTFNPVTMPLAFWAREMGKVIDGVNVMSVPGIGENTLLDGEVAIYNWARIVAVPKSAVPAVAEKFAAIAVMIPERGMVKEKFDIPPRFMVPPTKLMLEAAFPNPIKLAVSAS
ncbi:hypothetical protein ABH20_11325, partial [Geobacillus sp. T6]